MKFCECEQSVCAHGTRCCLHAPEFKVQTIFGTFNMCQRCAQNMPHEYLKEGLTVAEAITRLT